MGEPMILVDNDGAVRLLTFHRPEVKNAFNLELYRAAAGALRDANDDDGVHVVVLTGSGGAFSAGQDLKEMAQLAEGTAPEGAERGFQELLEAVQAFEKPLLAAVNGVGVGLGFTLLGHCDLVFMADEARLRVPFAELGVPPEAASSFLFPARMGWQRAAYILLTGEWVTAPQAVEYGIALERFPADRLLDEVRAVAQRIAASPPAATRAIKRAIAASEHAAVVAARAHEEAAFAELLFGEAAADALSTSKHASSDG
jgi:enoyl-CoA hydratase/carnithine racemase